MSELAKIIHAETCYGDADNCIANEGPCSKAADAAFAAGYKKETHTFVADWDRFRREMAQRWGVESAKGRPPQHRHYVPCKQCGKPKMLADEHYGASEKKGGSE